ncbi:transcription factor 20 isoform X1 [Pygocentrus nattereri]|uniref:transcription factor 20 isoform X1 n=1 Tax=Pygocentrus nattereri TaxID=42514 RepID=UPI001890E91C|nr:transcription factor 20 isoform X1 [Pygocentrus nattereri]
MQNFPNSPAHPPPGFHSRGGNMVGSPYPPHLSDPQISPRTTEDYAAMQPAQPILPSHGQHLHLRGQQQQGQVSSIHGYVPRRGAGEVPQAGGHSGSSSTLYRKENMDYYFSVSGRDRNRRGGVYGAGFGFPNMDGHIPHQYRHTSGSISSSGMVSTYPMDYSTSAASGSSTGNSSGSGSFSPTQQFSMAQNASMHPASGAEMHQRQHSQKYPSHQGSHQGQRAYSISGHRIPSQFGHYPPLNAPTAPSGMYNSPPQRYETSSGNMDSKINNSPTHSNPNSSTASNNSGHQENVGQTYPSSHPPYSPQSHPVHKHASRRTPQHSVGGGYDASLKMQHAAAGHAHPKNPQSSSPAAPHHVSQDMSKSPMHSQNQQTHMNQNFSPISNPSPAPSAVHSPSCSSSSSPLLGVSEGQGNTAPPHCLSSQPASNSSLLNTRSSHTSVRPSHTLPQLSPTPSSNSSISSCGSSAGSKTAGLNPNVVSSAMTQNRMGVGSRGGQRDESSSSLCPQDKLSQDPGLNSLNALTSQVANLPNTVQHMLLTDTVLSHKKGRDQLHLQQPAASQQKPKNASAASHIAANEESGDVLESELVDAKRDYGEPTVSEKMRQMGGSSTDSKPVNCYQANQSQTQTQMGQNRHGLHLQMDSKITETSGKQSFSQVSTPCSQIKTPETQTPSSSSPPSVPPFAEPSPNPLSCPPAPSATSSSTSSPIDATRSNCVTDPDLSQSDDKSALREKMTSRMKDERNTVKQEEHCHQEELDNVKHTQDVVSVKVEGSVPSKQNKNEKDDKKSSVQHLHSKHLNTPEQSNVGVVGVIVSARSEQNPEAAKQTEATSPHYATSYHLGKLNYSEEKHSVFRDSGSHNGDGETGMEPYIAHYDVSPKTEFGQNMPSNHCHSGSYKYSSPELPYNTCMGAKNKGKVGPGGGMSANRYQDYGHSQYNFGSLTRKDAGVLGRSGVAVGSRGQDSNSQLQQPYPSLLQEVLQGYHLDRRYGRPEQSSSAHHQPKNMSQSHYHTRLPYRMIENMRSHGVGQSIMMGASVHHQMASGKPHNQSQGPDHEMGLSVLHPSWDSEAQRPKGDHVNLTEKGTTNMSPSYSTHMQQSSDPSAVTPAKHINLADYSLPHRKPPSLATPPSAVQQLLLQETDALAANTETISQTQSQTSSSGRRSVICDVSPSRRTTPERDRGTSGPSVIQQPLSSTGLNEQGCSKEDVKEKKKEEPAEASKVNPIDLARPIGEAHSSVLAKGEPSKTLHAPLEMNPDLHRHSGCKGNTEPRGNASCQHSLSSEPLTSPTRRKPYSQALDGSGMAAYGFGDTVDGSKMNTPHPSHNPFHTLSSPSHIPPSGNKLQTYSHPLSLQHPHSMDDRFDWSANTNRPKEISVHQNSDQKCKIQSPNEVLPNQHHLSRQHSYPGSLYNSGSPYDLKIYEPYAEREGAGSQQLHTGVPHESTGSRTVQISGPKPLEADATQGVTEESAKSFHPPTAASAACSGGPNSSNVTPGTHQGHRPAKTGGSVETNPLMMRRRVRSFISPIPAKRQLQDFSSQRSGSYHSPVPHSESRQSNDSDSSNVDARPKLASPNTPYQTPSTNSPPQGKTKILPPRKGRGLKLEAIVQKITPNKKTSYSNSHVDGDYSDISHYSSDIPDPEIGAPFSSAPNREGGCLPYLDEAHSLDDLLPFRAEDAYSCDSQVLKQSATGPTSGTLRNLPTDFDFGLGTSGSGTGSGTGDDNKDDFTLLGPLPPPPPLPRPVQGSPPPSSSALSDIQQFTNTYQQLETRRGEQSAANLLRQKLQESGMGFDDYGGGDFYGTTPPHSQSPGHHLLSRDPQHQLGSTRMPGSDSKAPENTVPKGYFPSGKKKGRPVGSVNKQKRAQVQVQNATAIPAAPQTPPAAGSAAVTPQTTQNPNTAGESVTASALPDEKPCASVDIPAQNQPVKVEMESDNNQPEVDIKPVKHRQRKGKEGSEVTGSRVRQFRRRRGLASKPELDPQAGTGGNAGLSGVLQDARKNVFSPYIHVERKIAEIGAVCTIVNSEDEKSKGGGKGCGSAVDGPSNGSLVSQMVRKEKENERMQEKGIDEQTDSVQSGKSLPTSGYVLPGPVISETVHTGRFLCCLCQKWANYKNLGDLYGPFYPAEYAAKFPKNQPQIRQVWPNSGSANSGTNLSSVSIELATTDTQLLHQPNINSADNDCTVSQTTNPASPATTIGTASPATGEDLRCLSAKISDDASKTPAQNWDSAPEVVPVVLKPPDLESEFTQKRQQKVEDLQQRPQHRKLTSHPRFKRRHKSSEDLPRTIPINSKASLPFQPPPPSLDSLGPLAQLAQLPLVPLDPEELWVHESCIVWTSGVYLVNGRLYGLQEALDGARETSCSHCEMAGSTLGCYSKGCTLRYHYQCAVEADCYLNEDNFSLRCPKHKTPRLMEQKDGTMGDRCIYRWSY